jgi:hypothetical protein
MSFEFVFTCFRVQLEYFRCRVIDAYWAPSAYINNFFFSVNRILVPSVYDLDLYPLEDSFEFERKNL